MNAAAVLRVIVEAQTGPASASLAKFDGQLAATAANADRSLGRVVGGTEKVVTAGKRMQATGRTIAGVGKTIGLATVPLALFGAESVKMSLNFRRQMGLVATDAGGTAREVKKLEHSVLGLARTSQFGPQQLAESLFHVESSGYRGAKAMKVLNEAQKLATTGNSELQSTTYALVSATKALYGESLTNVNRTAAELNGIVAHGDMRLEELTAAMATGVIPKGKAMGLTLQDIGASMDVMTSRGIPAQRAAYALGFTLQKLIPYGEKAEDAFKSIGLGEEELIKTAQHGKFGYVSALEDLQRHLDQLPTKAQQTKVIEEMFGGGRMTSGLLTNLQNLGEMRKIYRELGDEVGKYNRHVKEAEEQPLVKMKAAWSSIQADMVEIGGDLLPVIVPGFEHLVHLADGAMHGFASLPPGLQSAAVEAGLIAIGLSGGLIVTGKLITAVGTLREAMAGLAVVEAGGALFGDLKAASSLALGGEMGGFRMLGVDAAKALGGGLVSALPMAIAGAGLVNIASSALHGDWEGVGFKAGGAVVGGIAGAFLGPEGAMVGAGIGSFIGGLLEPTKKLTPLQVQMAASAHAVARALGNEHDSAQALKGAQGHLADVNERVHRTSHELRSAEKKLADARRAGKEGTLGLFHAETRVFEAFRKQGEAIDDKRRALENLHFLEHQHGKSIGEVVHASALAISVEEKHVERLRERVKAEGSSRELTEKSNQAFKRLAHYQSDYAEAIRAAKNRNVEWARSLEEMTPVQHRFGEQGRALNRVISDQKQKLGEIRQAIREASSEYSGIDLHQAEAKLRRLEHTAAHVNQSVVSHMKLGQKESAAAAFLMAKEVAMSAGSMDTAVSSGLGILGQNLNSALKGLGVGKKVSFDLKAIATTGIDLAGAFLGQQTGGFTVPGNSTGDRHPYVIPHGSFVMNSRATSAYGLQNGGNVPVVLESRERVFMPHEVARIGAGNLAAMNASVPRFQKGGHLGAEPKLAGPAGPLMAIGQAAIHQVFKGAESVLAKQRSKATAGASHAYDGHSLSGKVSWFNGGATAGGSTTSQPGVALNLHPGTESGWDNKITRGFMADSLAGHPDYIRLTIQGHTAVLPITDLGPAGFTHRAIDVTEGGVRKLGISTGAFPTDAIGKAAFLQGGGPVGVRKRSDEGTPETHKEYVARIRHLAHRAWSALGRNRAPEPTISVDGSTTFGTDHLTSHIHIPEAVGGSLLARHPILHSNWAKRALIHEFAHTMQKTGIRNSIPEREGGASWFANIEAPGVWSKLRFPYKNEPPSYSRYLNLVQHEHDRDWAMHGQFKKFQRGGQVGLRRSGSPSGIRIVHPDWEPKFQDWMHGVWGRAKGLYGASGSAPDLFLARGLSGELGLAGLEQAGAVEMAPGYARGAMRGGYGRQTLLHEWAHAFQKPGLARWEREGGATAFSRWAGPRVFGAGFEPRWPGGDYRRWTEAVTAKRGADWIKHGQFLQKGGMVGRPQGLQTGGYVWPFQHANVTWSPEAGGFHGVRADQGVDFSGSGPIQAIGDATILGNVPPGWPEGGGLFYKLRSGPKAGKDIYVYEGVDNSASVGQKVSAGDVIASFRPGGSIEIGWATDSGETLAASLGHVEGSAHHSPEGRNFYGFLKQLQSGSGWSGKGQTKAQEVAHTYKEPVPAEYHGCKAKQSLHFGSMPKTLQGVEKEIRQRAKELGRYRRVAKLAAEKNKPAVAQALKHNITALETRLKQLRDEQTKLRREVVKKRFSRKLHRALGKVTGYEQLIEARQRDYNIASQNVEQIVGLEPQEPILPSSATEQQREAAEKNYLASYESYVNGTERPAFQDILGKEADWRNTILRAEYFGFGPDKPGVSALEWHWEGKIYEVGTEIENINAYTERVKADLESWKKEHPKAKGLPDALKKEIAKRDQMREKLPTLRAQDSELRKVLGEGRGLFYPGVKNGVPVSPPTPPLPGTGSFEDALIEVQGIHWPDQHTLISPLPSQRVAGKFGGAIWDTQSSWEELGLKIQQAAAGIGGGSGGGGASEGKSEREQLLETLLRQAQQREAINTALGPTLDQFKATYPFMGAYAKGGVALVGEAGPEIAHFPSGTRIHSADDTRRMLGSGGPTTLVIDHLHIHADGRVTASSKDPNLRVAVEEIIDETRSPMPTPGSFGAGFRP